MADLATAYLGLGANLGERERGNIVFDASDWYRDRWGDPPTWIWGGPPTWNEGRWLKTDLSGLSEREVWVLTSGRRFREELPPTVFLSLGSNMGDRAKNILYAVELLEQGLGLGNYGTHYGIVRSGLYETQPVGYSAQPAFLNCCVGIRTFLKPEFLLPILKDIERRAGRVESFRNAPRPLDIDILLRVWPDGDQSVVSSELLEIPHPRMHERSFVLAPLAEIMPNLQHPLLDKTIAELRDEAGFWGVRYWGYKEEEALSSLHDEELRPAGEDLGGDGF